MKAFYRLFYYISIVLTSILAGVTIAGAFVGNAAPDSFKFMPFIGLMLPILLLANLASVPSLFFNVTVYPFGAVGVPTSVVLLYIPSTFCSSVLPFNSPPFGFIVNV